MTMIPRAVTVPQLTDAIRALPMPLPVKEMLLDQALGYHDDLHKPARTRQTRTPMEERVAKARQCGAFTFVRTERDGTDVWLYRVGDEGRYEVKTRDERFLSCACRNFQIEHWHDPDYACKHGLLFLEMMAMPTEDEYMALVEDAAQAAAEFVRVWLAWRHGRATDEECDEAARRDAEARETAHQALPDVAGTWGEQWAREAAAEKTQAREGRAA